MRKTIAKLLLSAIGVLAIAAVAAPKILHSAGLHPDYTGEIHSVPSGKKALIIGTNHGILNQLGETNGDATGVAISEVSHPYYTFLDAGISVDIASINGGDIPVDPQTLSRMIITEHDKRYLKDPSLQAKMRHSIPISDLKISDYTVIFIAGGWGAAYDLGQSELLGEKMSEAYYASNIFIGAVCHGVLGLIKAKDKDGNLLIAGREMTGVTDKQIDELGITATPLHPESELRKAGAIFKSETAFRDVFATLVTVDQEKRFITGQNQNSGLAAAHKILELIATSNK
jgi:putative intracellular protease/amidase